MKISLRSAWISKDIVKKVFLHKVAFVVSEDNTFFSPILFNGIYDDEHVSIKEFKRGDRVYDYKA